MKACLLNRRGLVGMGAGILALLLAAQHGDAVAAPLVEDAAATPPSAVGPGEPNRDGEQNNGEAKIDPRVAAIMEQRRPRFERVMATQMSYIKRLCELSPEQDTAVREIAGRKMEETLRAFAENQISDEQVVVAGLKVRVPAGAGANAPPPLGDSIARAVLAAPEGLLSQPQRERLKQDHEDRRAFRRGVAVRALVAVLADQLYLTSNQQERLKDSLLAGWDPRWDAAAPKLVQGAEYLPSIPDERVLPLLDEDQALIWPTVSRQGFKVLFGFDGVNINDAAAPWSTGVSWPPVDAAAKPVAEE